MIYYYPPEEEGRDAEEEREYALCLSDLCVSKSERLFVDGESLAKMEMGMMVNEDFFGCEQID